MACNRKAMFHSTKLIVTHTNNIMLPEIWEYVLQVHSSYHKPANFELRANCVPHAVTCSDIVKLSVIRHDAMYCTQES